MKINEFVTKVETKGYMPISVDEQDTKLKKLLEVKPYLGIKAKKALVQDIIDETVLYENGLLKFNGIDQYIVYTMFCIRAYTNLEIENIEDDYDALCSTGLLNKVLHTFDSEYQEILTLLQMQCDYVLADNSITAQLNVVLNAATVALNKIGNSAEGLFKSEEILEIFNKLK